MPPTAAAVRPMPRNRPDPERKSWWSDAGDHPGRNGEKTVTQLHFGGSGNGTCTRRNHTFSPQQEN